MFVTSNVWQNTVPMSQTQLGLFSPLLPTCYLNENGTKPCSRYFASPLELNHNQTSQKPKNPKIVHECSLWMFMIDIYFKSSELTVGWEPDAFAPRKIWKLVRKPVRLSLDRHIVAANNPKFEAFALKFLQSSHGFTRFKSLKHA